MHAEQLCSDLGFDYREDDGWTAVKIAFYCLNDYVTKGRSVFKPEAPVGFCLKDFDVYDLMEARAAEQARQARQASQ